MAVRTVFRATDRLENQERFKVAIKMLKEDATRHSGMRPGPPQRRPPEPLNESGENAGASASWPDSEATTSNPDSSTSSLICLTGFAISDAPISATYGQPGGSRWDEIRKVQGVTHTSSWDRLREERQKVDMRSGPGNATNPTPPPKPGKQPSLSNNNRELTEQEQFDALLEAERKDQKGGGSDFSRWN